MKFMLSSNPDNLAAINPEATIEAEFGDRCVEGRMFTAAHHGPRKGQKAPCAYPNFAWSDPDKVVVGLSHVDLDTVGGCLALLGRKRQGRTSGEAFYDPDASFWKLAEFVDLNGAHMLGTDRCPLPMDSPEVRALYAYWAFSATHKVYAPRDGSVADVTEQVLEHVDAVLKILNGDPELLAAGDAHRAGEEQLNRESFVYASGGVIRRSSRRFCNHLYTTPDSGWRSLPPTLRNENYLAVINHNPGDELSGGAITLSFADPEKLPGINAGEILRGVFGPEAGGHAGIGGTARGKALPAEEADKLVEVVNKAIAKAACKALR